MFLVLKGCTKSKKLDIYCPILENIPSSMGDIVPYGVSLWFHVTSGAEWGWLQKRI